MQQLIRKDTDEVLVGYPPTYDTPTAAQIRVGTPAHAMGDSDSDYETATVESVSPPPMVSAKQGRPSCISAQHQLLLLGVAISWSLLQA